VFEIFRISELGGYALLSAGGSRKCPISEGRFNHYGTLNPGATLPSSAAVPSATKIGDDRCSSDDGSGIDRSDRLGVIREDQLTEIIR
jgi:hypothetical protein